MSDCNSTAGKLPGCKWLFAFLFLVENVQPDNTDHHRGDGQRVTDYTYDAAHVDVVNQPAGEADQVQNPNRAGIVNAQGDRGNQLCDDYKDTEGTMPGQKA